jgi:hypothetical protein
MLAPLSKFRHRLLNTQSEVINIKGASSKLDSTFSVLTMVTNISVWDRDAVNGGPRSLLNKLAVPAGVNAETCTAACKAAGFPLAGLEFGQECCKTASRFSSSCPFSL